MRAEENRNPFGPAGPIGMIGPMGPCAICPNCGSIHISWNAATDVSLCEKCGWRNNAEAQENFEKRRRNGEIA